MPAQQPANVQADPDRGMANTPTSRNAAAYSAVGANYKRNARSPSGINDNSKHMDAAALALDLASSSSWSDALSPSASTPGSLNEDSTGTQESEHSHNHTALADTELGPPPAYSSSHDHDSPTESNDPESENMRSPTARREIIAPTTLEHGTHETEYRDNPDDPLLGEPSEKPPGGWYPWTRPVSATSFRHHRSWRLYAAIGLAVIFILGGVLGLVFSVHRNYSSQREYPFIRTSWVHAQHETHKNIRGHFELWDKLELSTTTGNIDIEIDPMVGNGTSELILSSSTGSIKVGISNSWWLRPETYRSLRPIHTEIKTVEGSVHGRILLGNGGYASVDSVTGAQDLRVYVHSAGVNGTASELITRSHVGDQVVAVTHYGSWGSHINMLKAEHHSLGTANLDLQYSKSWRGEAHAISSAIGHLDVQQSAGVIYDKNEEHEVLVHKGEDMDRHTVDVIVDGTGTASFKPWYQW